MKLAINADEYAKTRVDIFFPADSGPPANGNDGDLTGQCVTLDKWFFNDMTDIPNPFAARGHARYLGDNLVAQGLADPVPAGQQKRGDVVCYIYGEYGHTGILLSGNRLFQQNANASGARRKVLSDGTVVYSSTIVPLYPALGGVAPKFYRLKSYSEEGIMSDEQIKQTALYLRLAAGDSLEKANANNANDLKQIKANIDYLPALAKQIYQGNEVFRWKASHYDEQVKANYDKGFQEGEAQAGDALYTPVAEVGGKPTLYTKKVK